MYNAVNVCVQELQRYAFNRRMLHNEHDIKDFRSRGCLFCILPSELLFMPCWLHV